MGEGYFCKIQEARKTWRRAYLHWKPEEDDQLRAGYKSGFGVERLSKIHERQPTAVERRLEYLGILK